MAVAAETASALWSNLVGRYYVKRGLDRLKPKLKLYDLAKKVPLPKNNSPYVYIHKMNDIETTFSTLSEGGSATQIDLTASGVTLTIEQKAGYLKMSEIIDITAIEPAAEAAVDTLAEEAATTLDKLILWRLTGASVGKSIEGFDSYSPYTGTEVHLCDVLDGNQGGLSTLYISSNGTTKKGNGAFMAYIFRMLSGQSDTTGYTAIQATVNEYQLNYLRCLATTAQFASDGVQPYEDGLYQGVAHPFVLAGLLHDPEFNSWSAYMKAEKGEKAVVGDFGGIKWTSSSIMPLTRTCLTFGSMSMVTYSCALTLVTAPDAFACTEIDGVAGFQTFLKRPTESDTSNPVNSYMTIGAKVTAAAGVLNKKKAYFVFTFVTGNV